MTSLRWIARAVFVAALLTWGTLEVKGMNYPETWPQSRRRTEAFIVMVAAGMLSSKPKRLEKDEEETF